jgi:CBS domain-containing protein
MKAQDMMTTDPACCTPESTAREAAGLMRERDCGCIPVVEAESRRLVGVVTDRDIACRCVAEGKGAETPIKEIMTKDPQCCHPEDDVAAIEQIMMQAMVRRVPVVDANGNCLGMVAQADLALHTEAVTESEIGRVVERISEPGRGDAGQRH